MNRKRKILNLSTLLLRTGYNRLRSHVPAPVRGIAVWTMQNKRVSKNYPISSMSF